MKEIPRVVNVEQEVKEAGWTPPDVQEQPGLEAQEAPESPRDYAPDHGQDDWEYVASDNPRNTKDRRTPFFVTPNGDSTVTVAKGKFYTYRSNNTTGSASNPISLVGYFLDFVEDDSVAITAVSGYIYVLCDISEVLVLDDTLPGSIQLYSAREVYSGTPEAVFSTTAPASLDPESTYGRNFAMVVAEVSLDSGVAAVEEQFVFENIPPLGGSYTYEPTP